MLPPLNKVVNMEQQAAATKPKAKKEVSGMRKLTSELDAQVRKVEINKLKMAKLQKTVDESNAKIKALTLQLSKQFA